MRYLAHLVTGEFVVIELETRARGPELACALADVMDDVHGWVMAAGGGVVNLDYAVAITPLGRSGRPEPLPAEDEADARHEGQISPEEGDALGRLAGLLADEFALTRRRGMNGGPFLPMARRSAENQSPGSRDDPRDDSDEDPQGGEGEPA